MSPWVPLATEDGTPSAEPRYAWHCEVCDQVVQHDGPWCELYIDERRVLCRPRTKRLLNKADAEGDGPLVNALCEYGRRRWGEDLDW